MKIPETDDSGSKNFSAKANPDGILVEFNVPAGVNTYVVNIDGIGGVARFGVEESMKADFFYPFVDAGKEYAVRIELKKPEGLDSEGYAISDETVYWFETKATAGTRSKGEVRITSFEEIVIEPNGNFRVTKKPTFKNETLLDEKWELRVQMFQGISWNHPDRRTKWGGAVIVPCTGFDKTYNIHSDRVWHDGLEKVDFVESISAMNYEHNGKTYEYRWGGAGTIENVALTPESQLWQTIDINNSADVKKIVGTWYKQNKPHFTTFNDVKVKELLEYHLIITSENVTQKYIFIYTRPDESEFTEEEKEKLCGGHEDEFSISPDNKTITDNYHPDYGSISEYFKRGDDGYPLLKVFEGEALLRIIYSSTSPDGSKYEYCRDYKKVK